MNKKIIGIFVMALLIATAVFPTIGKMSSDNDQVLDMAMTSNQDTSLSLTNHALYSGTGHNLNNFATIKLSGLTISGGISLNFSAQYQFYNKNDYGAVELSKDNSTWVRVWKVPGLEYCPFLNISVYLSDYVGCKTIYLRFKYFTDSSGLSCGVMFDNITLSCIPAFKENFDPPKAGWTLEAPWAITESQRKLQVNKTVQDLNGKWVKSTEACIYTNVTFKISIKNIGLCCFSELQNITVKDILPNCLEYVKGSSSPTVSQIMNNVLYWYIPGAILQECGSSLDIIFKAHVISEGKNENCVFVTASCQDCPVSISDCATVIGKNCSGCINVTKQVRFHEEPMEKEFEQSNQQNPWQDEITAKPGTSLDFLISVHNCDPSSDLIDIKVVDTLPGCLTYVPNSAYPPSPIFHDPPHGNILIWGIPGQLPYCNYKYISFTAIMGAPPYEDYVNINNVSVWANTTTGGNVYGHDTATIFKEGQRPYLKKWDNVVTDIIVDDNVYDYVMHRKCVKPGDKFDYFIQYDNSQNTQDMSVILGDNFPTEIIPIDAWLYRNNYPSSNPDHIWPATGFPGGGTTAGSNRYEWNIDQFFGKIPAGQKWTIKIEVQVDPNGKKCVKVTNHADANTDGWPTLYASTISQICCDSCTRTDYTEGFKKDTAIQITNICMDSGITNIDWLVWLKGGIILNGRETRGNLSYLPKNETMTIQSENIFGLGSVNISYVITTDCTIIKDYIKGFVIGPFIYVFPSEENPS